MNAETRPEGRAGGVTPRRVVGSDVPFYVCFAVLGGSYVLLILLMLGAELSFTGPQHLLEALRSREIQYATRLSLVSCTLTALLSLWVAVPLGYLLSRHRFPGKTLVE